LASGLNAGFAKRCISTSPMAITAGVGSIFGVSV
jgi:hypothetical protein